MCGVVRIWVAGGGARRVVEIGELPFYFKRVSHQESIIKCDTSPVITHS